MKERVIEILNDLIKKAGFKVKTDFSNAVEIPKEYSNGDFAFPCFILSKELGIPPHHIAIRLREQMKELPNDFEEIQSAGPYLNFFVNRKNLAANLILEIEKEKENYGKLEKNEKTVMIEFPSPNTNKPLHLGHLRNMAIGESVSRIYEFMGNKVIRSNLNNDRGTHICKSMLAYKKWGKNETPEKKKIKPDHFVGDFYVKFNQKVKTNPELELEAQGMLKAWEEGDKETIELSKKMNSWALEGFEETYKKFGIKLDKEYFESKIYKEGKDIILEGLKKKVFKKTEDGAIIIDLTKEGLGEKVLLRSDGTSIYITQDIYLAKKKFEDFKLDESIYVTGNEQEYHFNVLFNILEKLKIANKEKLKHLSYGMVNLPEGRMKSREGTVVDADDLIDELQKLIREDLKKRTKLKKFELDERSLIIALSALKYLLLKVDIRKNMVFNPNESISFEGDTGPYMEYSFARASSILRKVEKIPEATIPEKLEEKEIDLILKLNEFRDIVYSAYREVNPSLIANYSYKLAQTFNEFYHSCPVIGSDSEGFRLHLIESFRQILKNSLYLIGIDTVEEM
ncbi:arginine--tRNA ligase [archaeon]|nr:arginine--tRNA ligase [archaeon]